MKLREREIAAQRLPSGKTDALFFDDDVPGFALRLRSGGSGNWVFQYRVGTKQRRMTFGSMGSIPAARAREQAIRLYAAVKLGQDPAGEKNATRNLANETVGAMLPLFLARQKERLRPRAFVEVERHLLVHAKHLHGSPLANVTRRDIAAVLTAVASVKSGATANRIRASLSGFFAWAIREGLIDANPVAWTERREEVSRSRVLADAELREIWAALKDDFYGAIIKLLLLTGCRREEIGGLRWSEIDLDRALIALPSERVKNKRPHEIPLSEPALAILRAQRRLTMPDGSACDMVFARVSRGFSDWADGKRDLDQRIFEARKAALGIQAVPMDSWVVHDFRRAISTAMHERLGIMPHVVEAVLGHVGHRAGVAGTYNRSSYDEQKRIALQRWADHLKMLVSGKRRPSTVVKLRG
jgi:integrase